MSQRRKYIRITEVLQDSREKIQYIYRYKHAHIYIYMRMRISVNSRFNVYAWNFEISNIVVFKDNHIYPFKKKQFEEINNQNKIYKYMKIQLFTTVFQI